MTRRKSFWIAFVFLTGVFLTLSAAAIADEVGQSLSRLPPPVQERAREMIRAGVPTEDAVHLVAGMHASHFQAEQILKAQAIVLEAQEKGLPLTPVINKALEGMAKQVPPERTLQAMETVKSRYAFAYIQARSLAREKDPAERLGNMLAESLAAGFSEQDASRAVKQLKEHSLKGGPEHFNQIAAACLAMVRDMSRLGVSSNLSAEIVSGAIAKGLSTSDIASMHQSLLAQSQSHSAQSLAQGFAQGMQQGQASHGMGSPGQSGASGSGGAGGVGGPGGAGSGGGSGGAGGPGGGGSGGGGGGNR